jgi:hypothetical protein
MGIKYYYSAPQQIRKGYYLADAGGNIIYEFEGSEFIKNVPRVTICTILDGDKLSIGFTTCTGKDQFVKKIGQKIAKARAIKRPYAVVEISDIKEIHNISNKYISEIFDLETKRIYGVSD